MRRFAPAGTGAVCSVCRTLSPSCSSLVRFSVSSQILTLDTKAQFVFSAHNQKRDGEDTFVFFFGTGEIAFVSRANAIHTWKAGLEKKFQKEGMVRKRFTGVLEEAKNYAE